MPDIYYDVDTALAEVPVNIFPLTDDTDLKTIEDAVAYNAAGMALRWHFVTSAGAYTVTTVTPTTAGVYDWTDQGDSGIYTIEIPASGGASINNDTEGYGWFTGKATGVLPWRSPVYGFRSAALNDSLCDTNTTGLLAPTTAGRTLDVTATGAAGIDWANVENPTTTLGLTNTTVGTVTTLTNLPAITANWLTAAGINAGALDGKGNWNIGKTGYSLTATTGLGNQTANITGTVSTVTTLTNLPAITANWLTAAGTAADFTTEIQSGLATQASVNTIDDFLDTEIAAIKTKTDFLPSATAGAAGGLFIAGTNAATTITTALTTTFTGNLTGSVGSVTGAVGSVTGHTPQTGDSFARIGAAGAGLTNIGTIATVTNLTNLPAITANWLTAAGTATDFGTEVFNAVVTSQLTESYAADNTAPTVAQALFLIQQMLSEKAVASTTLTVKKLDGSTTAATFTLDSASTPTSITRTT